MINTIIFDLDGTLVDSLTDLGETVNYLLQQKGYPTYELEKYRYFVGNGVMKLLQRALPPEKQDELAEFKQGFDTVYEKNCLNNTKPYPGIIETIQYLVEHDYNLAVVTNKPQAQAVKIVTTLFPNAFSYVFGNTALHPKKPNPNLTNLVINLFDVNKNEVLYVGDSDVDMETAKNTKVKAIGVDWGFRGQVELIASGADKVVMKPDELIGVIHDWR